MWCAWTKHRQSPCWRAVCLPSSVCPPFPLTLLLYMWIRFIHPNNPVALVSLHFQEGKDWFQSLMTSIWEEVTFETKGWGGFTCLQLFTWLPGCFVVYLENIWFQLSQFGRTWPFGRKYSWLLWIKLRCPCWSLWCHLCWWEGAGKRRSVPPSLRQLILLHGARLLLEKAPENVPLCFCVHGNKGAVVRAVTCFSFA